ncbi:MAG: aldo/keto reductase [Clostridiales Family XIII bacterium]|jgi:predicted aldo/keto reductase-like oxidoreductase|nr:aldo/keto reductase [Clostridiales Family XIII bacterium]
MKYRDFCGEKVSVLGFGTMRLPVETGTGEGRAGKIDEKRAINLIRAGIDGGINYIDTAYMYHDEESEGLVKKALENGYRGKVFIADKLPVWEVKEDFSISDIFNKQLERLGESHIDFYLLHNANEGSWSDAKKYDALNFLDGLKKSGKVKKLGFSFHGETFELFKEVVDSYEWDFVQIQLNYMDTEMQAGIKGLKYLESKNIPVVIMEPLKGGRLSQNIPPVVKNIFSEFKEKRSPADWAFRWLANFPAIRVILSGMSDEKQLAENLQIFDTVEENSLSEKELNIIKKVADKYNSLIRYDCTACKYCKPCAVDIDIPSVMNYINEYYLYEKNETVSTDYKMFIDPKPSKCIECGNCMSHCPQSLDIIKAMQEAVSIFSE